MNRIVLTGIALLLGATAFVQNEEDALRYSMTYFGGTAKNMSTAGALSALGGDFSNASQNPAGLGRLTKSNFSFTQNVEMPSSKTNFYGSIEKANAVKYNFSNLSYVKAYELDPNKFKNWYSVQLGIGLTRIRTFNESFTVKGEADSSILHSFIKEAEGTNEADIYNRFPFSASLAYDTYALDPDPSMSNAYVTDFTSGKALHNRTVSRNGGITEFNLLTLSGNYANKLLVGASFNYLHIRYAENFSHKETYTDSSLWLQSIDYTGQLDIAGKGLNVRVGAIYMPIPQFRIGAAVETPSINFMSDTWTNNFTAETDDGSKFINSENVPTGSYKYNIRTPFKASVSMAYIIKKYGSVGFEVGYLDYRQAKISDKKTSSAPYSFAAENAQIENLYRSSINLKIGAEARINKQLYARLGFALYQTPYRTSSGNNLTATSFYTGGIGYNFGTIYLDLTYVLQRKVQDFYSYDPAINGSKSLVTGTNSQIALTIGARIKN